MPWSRLRSESTNVRGRHRPSIGDDQRVGRPEPADDDLQVAPNRTGAPDHGHVVASLHFVADEADAIGEDTAADDAQHILEGIATDRVAAISHPIAVHAADGVGLEVCGELGARGTGEGE